jgi:2-oxoglutarate dehydrogenase E1 component
LSPSVCRDDGRLWQSRWSNYRKVMNLDQFAGINAAYVLELYERYRQDPESVDPATRKSFESWTPFDPASTDQDTHFRRPACTWWLARRTWRNRSAATGIWRAHLDPIGSTPIGDPSLSPRAHGLTDDGSEAVAGHSGGWAGRGSRRTAPSRRLESSAACTCGTTGFDYAHVFVRRT